MLTVAEPPQVTAEAVHAFVRANVVPPGYLYSIVWVSFAKRMLAAEDCPANERLRYLQDLDTSPFTAGQIAAVVPIDDRGFELAAEALKLGNGRPGALDAFAMHFTTFAALNPTLLDALRMGLRGLKTGEN